MEKYIYDQKNGLWYEQNDDYCVPCLDLSEATQQPSGMWGRKELHYLKQHRPARSAYLLPSGRLNEYLAETDVQAATRFDTLIKQLIDERQITEQMKTQNQMAWVGEMNTIHNATEEVINAEIIYA